MEDLASRQVETITDDRGGKGIRNHTRLFFNYYIKPRGINTHLNELSDRAENQPLPRTLAELQTRLTTNPYIIYDDFADSGAMVDKSARAGLGIVKSKEDLPYLQVEYNSFMSDDRVGGKALASGFKMIPLIEGTRFLTLEDPALRAKLRVEVTRRS